MNWTPRYSGTERLAGCIWLPRLIDKAREFAASGVAPGEMLGSYMYGDSDYMDAKLLGFLRLNDAQIAEILRTEPDDERAAERIVERSGRTPDEIARFNRSLMLVHGVFMTMMDVDEGRRKAGFATPFVLAVYNGLVFPIGIAIYRFGRKTKRR